jgi:hypothetical protein
MTQGDRYRGHKLALWLFVPVLLVRTGIALGTIFNGRAAAQNADGIPLDTFSDGAVATIVALFAIWGLAQLVLSGLGVLAIARYRAMIPFMFGLFLIEHVLRKGILIWKPVARIGTPPGVGINLALLALTIAGFALSLWRRTDA